MHPLRGEAVEVRERAQVSEAALPVPATGCAATSRSQAARVPVLSARPCASLCKPALTRAYSVPNVDVFVAAARRFMEALYRHALSCTRYYYMVWYEKFKKAAGRLPAPYWTGPPIPLYNSTHDEIVRARRIADGL